MFWIIINMIWSEWLTRSDLFSESSNLLFYYFFLILPYSNTKIRFLLFLLHIFLFINFRNNFILTQKEKNQSKVSFLWWFSTQVPRPLGTPKSLLTMGQNSAPVANLGRAPFEEVSHRGSTSKPDHLTKHLWKQNKCTIS